MRNKQKARGIRGSCLYLSILGLSGVALIISLHRAHHSVQHYINALLEPLVRDANKSTMPQQQQQQQKPAFLVYCDKDKGGLSPLHMMSGFIPRMLDDPPPWNSTAFLVVSEHKECKENEYYKEAIRLHREAPYIQTDLVPPHNGSWVHGVKWPPYKKGGNGYSYPLKVVKDRPMLVKVLGEVFWRHNYGSCSNVDMVVYRSREVEWDDCLTLHYLQGVSHAYRLDSHDYHISKTAPIWLGQSAPSTNQTLSLPATNKSIATPLQDQFCGMVVGSVFRPQFYQAEALVRHAMFALLNEYKPCIRPNIDEGKCPGNDLDAFKCLMGYKFTINMDNTQENGYVSEKVFAGILSGAIPIYFGAPDASNYVNTKRIVFCNISTSVIQDMRSFYPTLRGQKKADRAFTFNASNPHPTDDELVDWAKEYLRKPLEPCINRIKELDQNVDAYNAVLQEPLITDPEILTGHDTLSGLDIAYTYLAGSPTSLPRFEIL